MDREVKLSQGYWALIDDEDATLVGRYRWWIIRNANGDIYAYAKEGRKTIYMHRLVVNAPKGMQVDHINHCGLDNRKRNLRLATIAENQWNQMPYKKRRSSLYRGVCWDRRKRKWMASISVNGKSMFLGYFMDEAGAALAHDAAAILHHGDFASLNIGGQHDG